ncbi:hypothetical protein J1TS3_27590 [Siminovitchia fordii]|uniref:Uncharacterized protein n=1 Tax=Siminovitchia fordii TaxID=254759 RepID=A0ABQ4K7C7_9BACI|nr:hypothetical protein J1TS3_27590 [Siminovitchia fordii]
MAASSHFRYSITGRTYRIRQCAFSLIRSFNGKRFSEKLDNYVIILKYRRKLLFKESEQNQWIFCGDVEAD